MIMPFGTDIMQVYRKWCIVGNLIYLKVLHVGQAAGGRGAQDGSSGGKPHRPRRDDGAAAQEIRDKQPPPADNGGSEECMKKTPLRRLLFSGNTPGRAL